MGIVSGGLCTVWWLPFRTDARPPLMTTPLPAGPCARLGRCPSAMRGCRRGRPPRLPWPLCLPKVWPGTGGRAYQDKDSVNVVGHNDKWFGLHAGIEGGHLVVQQSGRSFRVLQPHCPIHHLAEQEFTVLGADRQRIRTPLCVIVRRSIGGGIDTVSRVILSGFLWGCRRVGTGARTVRNLWRVPQQGCVVHGFLRKVPASTCRLHSGRNASTTQDPCLERRGVSGAEPLSRESAAIEVMWLLLAPHSRPGEPGKVSRTQEKARLGEHVDALSSWKGMSIRVKSGSSGMRNRSPIGRERSGSLRVLTAPRGSVIVCRSRAVCVSEHGRHVPRSPV